MTAVTQTIQVNLPSVVKTILLTNSTISARFNTNNNFYEFEPNPKASGFKGYPYILIRYPNTATDTMVFTHGTTMKEFKCQVLLRMDYEARNNFKTYANAIIEAIEDNEGILETNGYYNTKIELIDVNDRQLIEENQIVEGEFELLVTGNINRG